MPVSTTHAMIGALIGAGLAASATINIIVLNEKLLLPLLSSSVIAIAAKTLVYPLLRCVRDWLGITTTSCICVGNEVMEIVSANCSPLAMVQRVEHRTSSTGSTATCNSKYAGRFMGFEAASVLDKLHFLSARIVSFARGLNDTPKIAAMLLAAPAFTGFSACATVGVVIAIGGLCSARRVAETMSRKITPLNHGQAFTANTLARFIVISASKCGMPVSTTLVTCGALFGIRTLTGTARWRTIGTILIAWATTLPWGGLLGYVAFRIIS